jgi:hypothetical protein
MDPRHADAIRYLLRDQPTLLRSFNDDHPTHPLDLRNPVAGAADTWTDYDAERESLADAEPCDHFARSDWIDETTCGCGERVF